MSVVDYELVFAKVPSWTSIAEREKLAELAEQVPAGGLIVEIGALYGGMTVVMGTANPRANITSIDNFSWTPPGYETRPACKAEMERNLAEFGVSAEIIEGDSRTIGKAWRETIDLLWIDGGHSYDYVRQDLENFGPHAFVIALHDWDNKFWPDIRQAVEDFMAKHPGWEIVSVVETVVVLRKAPLVFPPNAEERGIQGEGERK